jgi:hypothetical protein
MGAPSATAVSVMARVWTTLVELLPAGGLWAQMMANAPDSSSGGASRVSGPAPGPQPPAVP